MRVYVHLREPFGATGLLLLLLLHVQEFAKAYRQMQLSGTLFAVAIIQVCMMCCVLECVSE
jgi:hypothetical protein